MPAERFDVPDDVLDVPVVPARRLADGLTETPAARARRAVSISARCRRSSARRSTTATSPLGARHGPVRRLGDARPVRGRDPGAPRGARPTAASSTSRTWASSRSRARGRASSSRRCSRTTSTGSSPGEAQYTLLTNERGGIVDDLIVYRLEPVPLPPDRQRGEPRGRLRVAQGARDRAAPTCATSRTSTRCSPCRGRARSSGSGSPTAPAFTFADGRARRRRRAWSTAPATRASAGVELLVHGRGRGRALGRGRSRAASCRAASARATRCGSRSATRCTATTSGPTPTRSRPASAGSARSTRSSPASSELREIKEDGPGAAARRVRDGGAGDPAAGDADRRAAARSPPARTRRCSSVGIGLGYVPRRAREPGHRADDRRPRHGRGARAVVKKPIYKREEREWPQRELSRRPALPPRARLGAHRGRRGDARHHLVRAGRARRARPLRAARRSARRSRRTTSYGEVESVKAVSDLIAPLSGEVLEVNAEGRRRARDGERGPLRRGLARPRSGSRDPAEVDALLDADGVPAATSPSRRDATSSLTDADREAMLAAIGVSSVEELFRDIPAGVRFGRELDLEPALSEPELVAHLEELAARERRHRRELSFLGAGIYDHYVPAVVDAVLQRGEFLTAYTPYQPELSQGVLQAIFEYQTAICELTGMDVSNASGYDGTTVAADACYVAKHATGPLEGRRRRGDEPAGAPGREDLRARLRARGRRGAAPTAARPTRTSSRAAAEDAACVIFQQPNFFGCLEPAPDLAAAANEAGALPVAHVDPISLGVLEAPGRLRLRDRDRRGPGAPATPCPTAARTTASSRRRSDLHPPHAGPDRRRDDRRRGRARLRPDAADARAAHPPREGDLEHHDEPDAARARGPRLPLAGSGPQGLREVGETCMALAAYAKERLAEPVRARVSGSDNVQGVCRPRRTDRRARSIRDAREQRRPPRLRARPRLRRAWTTRSSSRSPRSARRPTSTGSRRCSAA